MSARLTTSVHVTLSMIATTMLCATVAAAGPSPHCGMVVGPGETVTLTAPLGPCDDDTGEAAVTVDSGTLIVAGFVITCEDTAMPNGTVPNGVVLIGTHATVQGGGLITGCRNGLRFEGTGKHSVDGLAVNSSTDHGVYIAAGSDGNKLRQVVESGAAGNGIRIESDKNKLLGCIARHDGLAAIKVDGTGNRLKDSGGGNADTGFDISGDANKLINCGTHTTTTGFNLSGQGTKLKKFTALYQNTGVLVAGSGTVIKGDIFHTTAAGIEVDTSAPDVKIIGNMVTDPVSGTDLIENTPGCSPHIWKKNLFATSNDPCIK